eukprot:170956_1
MTSNKWGRGSHMFFSQVALHTGLYKQLKIMGFLEMPHQNTIRIREDVFNLRDTISSKYFKSMQRLYEEYCDHWDIPLDQRIPFFIQAHDEVYIIKGMFYCPANHKVYGMTSDLKEKMQIKSVFEIFRGIAKITPSKIIQQTLFIDLRSG